MASQFVLFTAAYISLISLTAQLANGGNAIPSVKILVVGKTGSGKSTLVNGLFGSEKAEVGHSTATTLKSDSETKDVECFDEVYQSASEKKQNFKVTICDSPGFRDTSFSDDVYIGMLQSKCNDPDLVLYVVSMRETRWTIDQVETIALVNKALGKEIWKNTLLVLTFTNKVNDVKMKDEFLKKFVQSLDKIGVKTDGMPVALAGHLSESQHLPEHGIEYWYTQLFLESVTRVKRTGADALMLLVLYHKDRLHLTEGWKEVFCTVFNSKASKAVFAIGTLTIFMAVLPFAWIPTVIVAAVGALASALGYTIVENVTTLDEFCNST